MIQIYNMVDFFKTTNFFDTDNLFCFNVFDVCEAKQPTILKRNMVLKRVIAHDFIRVKDFQQISFRSEWSDFYVSIFSPLYLKATSIKYVLSTVSAVLSFVSELKPILIVLTF